MRELTRETLQFFSERDQATPAEYAVAVGHYPIRAAYTWLARLRRYACLRRRQDFRGRLAYQLTGQGARRLLYLKSQARYNGAP
jgi:hypothetical protein